MNMLKEFYDFLEDKTQRTHGPEVIIMITRKQALDLWAEIHRILAFKREAESEEK